MLNKTLFGLVLQTFHIFFIFSLMDQEMVLESEDLDRLSVASLRKRISCFIQSQLGMFKI